MWRIEWRQSPYGSGIGSSGANDQAYWPGWAVKAAILAAVLVVAVPLLLLTLAALIVGALVLLVLVAAAVVVRRLRRLGAWLPGRSPRWRDEGRRNVRVIEREFHHS